MMHSFSVCCADDAAAAPTSRRLTWSAVAVAVASSGVEGGRRQGGTVHKKSVIINARKKPKIAASVAFVFQVFGSGGRTTIVANVAATCGATGYVSLAH